MGITAAGWAAIGSTAVSAGAAIYQAKSKPGAPKISAAPTPQAMDDGIVAARERRRAGLGGGLASTILAGNTSANAPQKSLLGT